MKARRHPVRFPVDQRPWYSSSGGGTGTPLPDGSLANLYAAGRVIVAFGVAKEDVLRLARSSEAFPDVDSRFIPDVTKNPRASATSYEEPLFSIVFRLRPGTGSVAGAESTREFQPLLRERMLADYALEARGISAPNEDSNSGGSDR